MSAGSTSLHRDPDAVVALEAVAIAARCFAGGFVASTVSALRLFAVGVCFFSYAMCASESCSDGNRTVVEMMVSVLSAVVEVMALVMMI